MLATPHARHDLHHAGWGDGRCPPKKYKMDTSQTFYAPHPERCLLPRTALGPAHHACSSVYDSQLWPSVAGKARRGTAGVPGAGTAGCVRGSPASEAASGGWKPCSVVRSGRLSASRPGQTVVVAIGGAARRRRAGAKWIRGGAAEGVAAEPHLDQEQAVAWRDGCWARRVPIWRRSIFSSEARHVRGSVA